MEPHAVPTREEEAEALHKALSPGSWHWHCGGAAAMIVIGRHNRMTRCLGSNAACLRSAGEAVGEGMRPAAHSGLDGAPWLAAWLEFHRRAARRGAEEGGRFGTVTGAVSGRVHNGFRPRGREADVRGPRDTGAHLAATRGRKTAWLVCRDGMGQKCYRNGPVRGDMAHEVFSIFNSIFQLNKSTGENKNRRNT
jgi:hypothetical protein